MSLRNNLCLLRSCGNRRAPLSSASSSIHMIYKITVAADFPVHFSRFKSNSTAYQKANAVEVNEPLSKPETDIAGTPNNQADITTDPKAVVDMFGNYQEAYCRKSSWELARALSFFALCRFPSLTDNALRVMELSRIILRKRLSDFVIRHLVYGQFVAGETIDDIQRTVTSLKAGGVGPILYCPLEQDRENIGEIFFDQNTEKLLDSVDKAIKLKVSHPMIQFRLTALISGDVLKEISPMCLQTVNNIEVVKSLAEGIQGKDIDFSELPGWKDFPQNRSEQVHAVLRRMGMISKAIVEHDTIALIDAEYLYMNPALRLLSLALMWNCNKDKARAFYTYQAYLKQTYSELLSDLEFAKANNFSLGVKLVRGAYMVHERLTAQQQGYPDPVNDDFDATTKSYYACLNLLLKETAKKAGARYIIASHNEDTVCHAMRRMDELGIPKDSSSTFFGQVYGMADHVSFTLARQGYNVYKSVPFGDVENTLPYLARRAQENKSMLLNARRERNLISAALKDRLLFRDRAYT